MGSSLAAAEPPCRTASAVARVASAHALEPGGPSRLPGVCLRAPQIRGAVE